MISKVAQQCSRKGSLHHSSSISTSLPSLGYSQCVLYMICAYVGFLKIIQFPYSVTKPAGKLTDNYNNCQYSQKAQLGYYGY